MKLSSQDADLFFQLMWGLHLYINQKHKIFPHITSVDEYRPLSRNQKAKVRAALYEDAGQIADFVTANPQRLSADELAIVAGWQRLVAGKFFIERLLKKQAIFIQDEKVFGVLGLYDELEDVIEGAPLPLYVDAVLLPFKGKIIYDGLLQPYNVYFGSGISSELREAYLAAKQNGTIIESLDAPAEPSRAKLHIQKDWRPDLDELASMAARLRANAGDPAVFGPAFSLVKASLEFAQSAAGQPEDVDELRRALKKVHTALRKAETTLTRAE